MPPSAGLSLKPEHFDAALECRADGIWFEVHAENYMTAGGPRAAWLRAVRERHPVSLHGVGLSLAGGPLDAAHLARLATLVRDLEPALVSEHLAWSRRHGACFPDLLPVPRCEAALRRIAENVDRLQNTIGRLVSIENPSHYLAIPEHECSEPEFLGELARRTGCRLLIDVNNMHVSAANLGGRAEDCLDAVPGELIAEIHLAGHSPDPVHGAALLIDSHDCAVAEPVWSLYHRLVGRIGARPTLIERDGSLPPFEALLAERGRAQTALAAARAAA